MAFNWLSVRQSGWERDSEPNMARRMAVGGLGILLVGILIGVGVSALAPKTKAVAADNSVAPPSLENMKNMPKTEDGAVRAVTSYITGFPSVALRTPEQQRKALDETIAGTADASLRTDMGKSLVNARDQLLGNATSATGQLTARLIVSPASYRVDMLSPERARVQMWYQMVFINAIGQQASSTWYTSDIQVAWSDHWRLATNATKLGPTPSPYSDRVTSSPFSDVLTVINGFKAYQPALAAPSS